MDDDVIFIRATTAAKRGAADDVELHAAERASPSDVAAHGSFTSLAIDQTSERSLARENKKMQKHITALKKALKHKNEGCGTRSSVLREQIATLKEQIESQDKASKTEVQLLREHNTKLAQDRAILEGALDVHKDTIRALETEITGLTGDVREQKKLQKMGKNRERSRNEKLGKELSRKVERLEHVDAVDKDERIKKLQHHVTRLEQGFRERGEQIIKLSRDAGAKSKLKDGEEKCVEG